MSASRSSGVLECAAQARHYLESVCDDNTAALGTAARRAALFDLLLGDAQLLHEVSLEYKNRANALLPAVRLPREIILSIFLLVADQQRPRIVATFPSPIWEEAARQHFENSGDRFSKILPASIGWICLSHVCRSWRALCLSSPTLWSTIIGLLPQAIPECLERSGNTVPLQVRVHSDTNAPATPPSAIFGIVPTERIQMIEWDTTLTEYARVLMNEICDRNLPFLEVLKLQLSSDDEEEQEEESPLRTDITLVAPRLKELALDRMFISFSTPNLSSLSLHSIDDLSCIELIHVLSTCPQLRTVELCLPTFHDADEIKTTDIHVTLRHLESLLLQIDEPAEVYNDILNKMTIPSSVNLQLFPDIMHNDGTDDDLGVLAITIVALIWRHKPCDIMEFDDTAVSLGLKEEEKETSRSYTAYNGYDFDLLPELLPDHPLRPFFKDITILRLSAAHGAAETSTFSHIFNLLPNVVHLCIIQGTLGSKGFLQPKPARSIFRALWDSNTGFAPLPNLSELRIAQDVDVASISLDRDVLKALVQRAEISAPRLNILELQCYKYPGEFEPITLALGNFVDDIRWQ